MKNKLLIRNLAIALGLSVAMTGGAGATIVASWDYTQEFEFVETILPTSVNKEGATLGVNDVDGFTKLSWGSPSNTFNQISSLVINPDEDTPDFTEPTNALTQGNVVTSTDLNALTFADGPVIVHNNFVITGNSLTSAFAEDYIRLTPDPTDGLGDQIQEVTFGIQFVETVNDVTEAACAAVTSDGTQAYNEFGCGDIFVLSGGLLGEPTVVNTTEIAFLIDSFFRGGNRYDVFLREKTGNLTTLSDQACTAAGSSSGCIGWVTNENEATFARLEFAVLGSEVPVPAPATLLLLSGGLLGLGAVLRRKHRSASV